MADNPAIEVYKEYRAEIRHQETQRSAVSTILLTLTTALIGLSFKDADATPRPYLGLITVNFSLVAIIISMKLYERFTLAKERTRRFLNEIESTYVDIVDQADAENRESYKYMPNIRLHVLWQMLFCGTLATGCLTWWFQSTWLPAWKLLTLLAGPSLQLLYLRDHSMQERCEWEKKHVRSE